MTNLRSMNGGSMNGGWIAAALVAACGLFASASAVANPPGLEVRLSAPAPVLQGDVDVTLTVTLVNTTRHPIQVLKWQLPEDDLEAALFRIVREDGSTVRYEGPIVKRAAPQAQDHVRIDAGATVSYTAELTANYDLSRSGRYSIEYASPGGHGAKSVQLRSEPIYLWLEGRSGKGNAPAAAPAAAAAPPVYSSCSATQQSDLVAATNQAVSYSNQAVTYLAATPSPTQRYVKWFGSFNNAGWNSAMGHFGAIQSAFTAQNLAFDCKCKKPSTYAYVYSNQPYKIYLCGAFWKAPLAGTDSRGGTLIHEMSHFNVVASTNDWAYGQTAAANLALTNPANALDNADSHEYFAENTPALP